MRFLERKVFGCHEVKHVHKMAFRVMLSVPKKSRSLSFCNLFQFYGVAD